MKTKTSITLSEDVLSAIEELAGPGVSRSAFIERVLRSFVRQRRRAAVEARELASINRQAKALNAEAADVLTYQMSVDNDAS